MSYGRGRGRGRGLEIGPILRDDEGTTHAPTYSNVPPPLYPPLGEGVLPPLPKPLPHTRDQDLLNARRQLKIAYNTSPYYLRDDSEEKEEAGIERYSDRFKEGKKAGTTKGALEQILMLAPQNFPIELYNANKRQRTGNLATMKLNQGISQDLRGLDELARLEKKYADEEANEQAEKGKEKKEGEDAAEVEVDEVDDDYDYEDEDDYAQNYGYDDDDGYLDDDFGGDDGEATVPY
mmetsp:Transcript_42488/g.51562  ORF Transcript_42488/g.51562 Transcript_42488/m.51562 type:complete len:235 (-) Transcript_42488:121-825(-)|eukprot:CAMPEP_0197851884 /NCGR_PEP_ID=MMETSP1438-20131217/19126_1 /TAXON_ID=1461541 /ORGANISM="Pterosperma sp., Strain CCMP1384" /LENGTH=234 /DNA_ID=CAMNT_0043465661 /DNA_START=161 /DNA_END=865 /DNA_ORIENTATION=+